MSYPRLKPACAADFSTCPHCGRQFGTSRGFKIHVTLCRRKHAEIAQQTPLEQLQVVMPPPCPDPPYVIDANYVHVRLDIDFAQKLAAFLHHCQPTDQAIAAFGRELEPVEG